MRLLITGGRDFSDAERLESDLERIDFEHCIDVVIHGDAQGADKLADRWARRRGVAVWAFKADGDFGRWGGAAGAIRNQRMIDEASPTHILAMPGGNGTADMIDRAQRAGLVQL